MTNSVKSDLAVGGDNSANSSALLGYLSTPLILFGLTALMIFLSRFISPSLGGMGQINAILVLSSFLLFVAFGQQMVVLSGGLDLSVPSVIVLGGLMAYNWSPASAAELAATVAGVVAITGAVGAVSGLGVTLLGIPPFIMTMSSGVIVYSTALGFTGGTPFGTRSEVLAALFGDRVLGVPPVVLIVLAFVILALVLQSLTVFGRKVYAIGINPRAAHIAGLSTTKITVATYAISGASAGLCGVFLVGFSGGATMSMGEPYLLPSIAAVVVGGTAITGGRGNYLSVVAAVLLVTTFTTVISSIRAPEGWRIISYGLIVLGALMAMNEQTAALTQRIRRFPRKTN